MCNYSIPCIVLIDLLLYLLMLLCLVEPVAWLLTLIKLRVGLIRLSLYPVDSVVSLVILLREFSHIRSLNNSCIYWLILLNTSMSFLLRVHAAFLEGLCDWTSKVYLLSRRLLFFRILERSSIIVLHFFVIHGHLWWEFSLFLRIYEIKAWKWTQLCLYSLLLLSLVLL